MTDPLPPCPRRWWTNPDAWDDDDPDAAPPQGVERPTEAAALTRVRAHAELRRTALLLLVAKLDRWYLVHCPGMVPFERIHAIAARLRLTPYEVGDLLIEGDRWLRRAAHS